MQLATLSTYDNSLDLVSGHDFNLDITGITTIEFPGAGRLLFIKDVKYLRRVEELLNKEDQPAITLQKMVLVVDHNLWSKSGQFLSSHFGAILTSKSVDLALTRLSKPFYEIYQQGLDLVSDGRQKGSAEIASTAQIAPNTFIGDGVLIDDEVVVHAGSTIMSQATIAKGTIIYPNVTIYPHVKIGERCRIHAGSVIGSDGFGYNFDQGEHLKIWHIGGVVIGNDVEVGACTTIDSGTFTPTLLGDGSKLDNQVQIAHNCKLGRGVIMCGQSGLAGSATLGDYTLVGGKAAVGPGFTLGDRCQIGGAAVVNNDWPDDSILGGHPARPVKEWLRGVAHLRKEALKKDK
jgi:UDP-3-O-[3-hydroxymyristoyl] glucosamine N-acyltransferase